MPLSPQQRRVINAAVAGNVVPTLSQNRKVLDVRTPAGRVSLEISGQGLTEAGREYFRRRGIRWALAPSYNCRDRLRACRRTYQ